MTSLRELAWLFLRLGFTSFGGPAAHVAMMENEIVRRRAWMTRERFLDLWGATNLIPGPNSTEMAIHIGRERAGGRGLMVAGIAFVAPAAAIVTAIAWAYMQFGALPRVEAVLYGIKPVVIAIIVRAIWGLGRTAVRSLFLATLAIACLAASFAAVDEITILFATGVVGLGYAWIKPRSNRLSGGRTFLISLPVVATAAMPAAGAVAFGLWPLFLFFLKVGSVIFGSGYVLFAFLHTGLVERLHWLTETQLVDAITVGQVTPGPVFTTATFVGYLLGGPSGAAVATVGIFLPAFVLVGISSPLIARIRRSRGAGAFLDAVNVASLALMAHVTIQLSGVAVVDLPTIAMAMVAFVLLIARNVNSAWLVIGGGIAGILLH